VIGIGLLRLVKWFRKTDFTGDPASITSLFLNCQVAREIFINSSQFLHYFFIRFD